MTLTSSITNAVVILIVVVVIVGVVLGLFMSGSDLLNPTMSAAKQRRMDEETQHLAQMNWLEEQKLVEKNRIDIEHARQKAELSLVLLRIREYALTAAGALALVIVAIGTAILLAGLGYRWSRAAPQAAHPITIQSEDAWRSRAYRDARIQEARLRERQRRQAPSSQPTMQDQSAFGNDGRQPERIPL
jgi:predicted PurR-regulated permease PerM